LKESKFLENELGIDLTDGSFGSVKIIAEDFIADDYI